MVTVVMAVKVFMVVMVVRVALVLGTIQLPLKRTISCHWPLPLQARRCLACLEKAQRKWGKTRVCQLRRCAFLARLAKRPLAPSPTKVVWKKVFVATECGF